MWVSARHAGQRGPSARKPPRTRQSRTLGCDALCALTVPASTGCGDCERTGSGTVTGGYSELGSWDFRRGPITAGLGGGGVPRPSTWT